MAIIDRLRGLVQTITGKSNVIVTLRIYLLPLTSLNPLPVKTEHLVKGRACDTVSMETHAAQTGLLLLVPSKGRGLAKLSMSTAASVG